MVRCYSVFQIQYRSVQRLTYTVSFPREIRINVVLHVITRKPTCTNAVCICVTYALHMRILRCLLYVSKLSPRSLHCAQASRNFRKLAFIELGCGQLILLGHCIVNKPACSEHRSVSWVVCRYNDQLPNPSTCTCICSSKVTS